MSWVQLWRKYMKQPVSSCQVGMWMSTTNPSTAKTSFSKVSDIGNISSQKRQCTAPLSARVHGFVSFFLGVGWFRKENASPLPHTAFVWFKTNKLKTYIEKGNTSLLFCLYKVFIYSIKFSLSRSNIWLHWFTCVFMTRHSHFYNAHMKTVTFGTWLNTKVTFE